MTRIQQQHSAISFLEFFYQPGWQYPALIDPFPENDASVLARELGKVQRDYKPQSSLFTG